MGNEMSVMRHLTELFVSFAIPMFFGTIGFGQTFFTEASDSLNPKYQRCSVGVAWGDYDNDGNLDIYVVNLGQANSLYKNNGRGAFRDIASDAGVDDSGDGVGCAWADFDNDGDLDLFVSNRPGPNRLYRNNGDSTFTDIADSAGLSDPSGNGESVAWADYDNDGLIDLYMVNYFQPNRLYANNGDGTFRDIADSAGVGDVGRGEGVAWADFDNDGDQDVLVVNYGGSNVLYSNNGDGTFGDITDSAGVGGIANSLGIAWGDYDNDGDLDLYVAQAGSNILYANRADGTFEDVTSIAGIGGNSWSLGTAWGDYDNDGWLDLYVANHMGEDDLYLNNTDGTFTVVTDTVGMSNPANARGCAWADYDNDGDLDLFVANHDYQFDMLYRNEGSTNHWLVVKTVGTTSNSAGIGTRLEVRAQATKMVREVSGGSGFASQNSLPVEFGLGMCTEVDTLIVKWPSGIVDSLFSVEADTTITVTEVATGVKEEDPETTSPKDCMIYDNYPDPFYLQTTIRYSLAEDSKVTLRVYNIVGQQVRMLVDEFQRSGIHRVIWDGRGKSGERVPSGIYFYRLAVEKNDGTSVRTKTMLFLH